MIGETAGEIVVMGVSSHGRATLLALTFYGQISTSSAVHSALLGACIAIV